MCQVIESAVTFKNENSRQEEIIRRVATLVELDPMFQDGLGAFTGMQNQLVHDGEFIENGEEPLQMLKLLAEACISRLIWLEKKFTNVDEIRPYLEYNRLSEAELSRKINVVNAIHKFCEDRSTAKK
jgi:hypothetical protein